MAPEIDLGLLSDPADLPVLVAALRRLRGLIDAAPFEARAQETHPGRSVETEEALADHVRGGCGTSYHPVGTLRMGGADAPVTPELALRGVDGLWVADASVIPSIPSSNTNAPSIMIGHRASAMVVAAGSVARKA
jgi:choline dehydrogenase-like flavoprotein